MNFEVKYVEKLEGNHVAGFLTEGYVDLMNQGFAPRTSTPPIGWDQSAFYIELGKEIAAAVAFNKIEWKNCLYVTLGYVHPEFRRKGLYTALWDEVVRKAKEMKVYSIQSSSHIGNTGIEKFNRVRGRTPVAVTYEYLLDTRGDS